MNNHNLPASTSYKVLPQVWMDACQVIGVHEPFKLKNWRIVWLQVHLIRSYYRRTTAATICMDHTNVCSCAFGSGTGVLRLIQAYHSHDYRRTTATTTGVQQPRLWAFLGYGNGHTASFEFLLNLLSCKRVTPQPEISYKMEQDIGEYEDDQVGSALAMCENVQERREVSGQFSTFDGVGIL